MQNPDRSKIRTEPAQYQPGSDRLYPEAAQEDNLWPELCGGTAGMVADRQGHARQTTRPDLSGRDDITQYYIMFVIFLHVIGTTVIRATIVIIFMMVMIVIILRIIAMTVIIQQCRPRTLPQKGWPRTPPQQGRPRTPPQQGRPRTPPQQGRSNHLSNQGWHVSSAIISTGECPPVPGSHQSWERIL